MPPRPFQIRSEVPGDEDGIASAIARAFGQPDEAELVARIRARPGFDPNLSLVAIEGSEIVGHILFSPIVIEEAECSTPALSLAPMAVVPSRQRLGIGSLLVKRGLEACRDAGNAVVIVLGHPEYYPRFGFAPAQPLGIHPPFPVPSGTFLVLELTPRALDGVVGTVRYPPEFDIQ